MNNKTLEVLFFRSLEIFLARTLIKTHLIKLLKKFWLKILAKILRKWSFFLFHTFHQLFFHNIWFKFSSNLSVFKWNMCIGWLLREMLCLVKVLNRTFAEFCTSKDLAILIKLSQKFVVGFGKKHIRKKAQGLVFVCKGNIFLKILRFADFYRFF